MPAHELQQTRGDISRGQSVLSMLGGYLNWLAWSRAGMCAGAFAHGFAHAPQSNDI